MAALMFGVWFTLMRKRLRHIADNAPSRHDFASAETVARYFQPVERPAQNLANLFEMPVLYFALVPLLIATHQANDVQTVLAWGFVQFRALHSVVHVGRNVVRTRFRLYLASCIILAAMWIGLALDLVVHPGGTI
jgi:hypothetical protein